MTRWRVAGFVCAAIAISYLDRQSLPVAVQAIQRDIPLTNTQFGALTSTFLLAYALMYAGGGLLVDRLGTRRGFLLIMIVWSLACASHSVAAGVGMLAMSRFLLGLGEGGGFPAATKVIAEWFPVAERSTAMGIVNAGTAVGAVVAPPAIAAILLHGDWRWVFLACGAAGLVWAVWWAVVYREPKGSRLPDQRDEGKRAQTREPARTERGTGAPARERGGGSAGAKPPGPFMEQPVLRPAVRPGWLALLSFPQVWGLVIAKFLTDAAWFFYISWLPKYLYDARHFDVKQVGAYAWVPYAASGVGCLLGGWFSSALLVRGRSVDLSRKLALGLSAAVMPAIVFVTHVPVDWAIVIFSVAFFGQQSWSTLVMIVPTDLFDRHVVATVAGLVGFGGAMGGLLMNLAAGRLLDAGFGYGTVFAIVGSLHLIAFVVILIAIPRIGRLDDVRKVA